MSRGILRRKQLHSGTECNILQIYYFILTSKLQSRDCLHAIRHSEPFCGSQRLAVGALLMSQLIALE